MATKFNLGFTPTDKEVENVSEVVVREVFIENESLNSLHDVQTGIFHDQQIVFADGFDVTGEAISGCTPTELGDIAISEKVWSPKLMGNRFTYCANDENKLFKILKKAKNTFPDFFDRQNSPDLELISAILLNSISGSVLPKVWFGDTAASLQPGGDFKAGSNLGLFNQFDGLFKQIAADGSIPVHTITKNAAGTFVAQALAADEALTILEAVYKQADIRLKSQPDAKMYVTRTIHENLLFSYANKGADNGGLTQDLQTGISTLKYLGVEVVSMDSWDYTINTYTQDGVVWVDPHRVVYTTPGNIPIGTLSQEDLASLDMVYDVVGKQNIIDYGWFMDAKMLTGYLVSTAI